MDKKYILGKGGSMKKLAILLVFALMFTSGCIRSNTITRPILNVDTRYPNATLVIGSKQLLGKVVLKDVHFRKVGNFTQAEVTVQNTTNKTYYLEYMFEWQDNQGFSVDEVKVWRPFTLTPYQVRKFTSTGPIPEASKITFTIRFPEKMF